MEAPAGLNEQQQILLGLLRQAAGPGPYPIQQIDQVCANLPPPPNLHLLIQLPTAATAARIWNKSGGRNAGTTEALRWPAK